jgi:hypothetical protein
MQMEFPGDVNDSICTASLRVGADLGAFRFSKKAESGSTRMTSLFIDIYSTFGRLTHGRCRSKKAQIIAGPFGSMGDGPNNRGRR